MSLTSELRQALRQKRQELHATLQDVSRVLGVHWTTYRKWEEGQTQLLSCGSQLAVRDFLSGKFDYFLRERPTGVRHDLSSHDSLRQIMESDTEVGLLVRMLCDTYLLLGDDLHERKLLRTSLEEVLKRSHHHLEQQVSSRSASRPECAGSSGQRLSSDGSEVTQA